MLGTQILGPRAVGVAFDQDQNGRHEVRPRLNISQIPAQQLPHTYSHTFLPCPSIIVTHTETCRCDAMQETNGYLG
eukprot:356459-Chlamydomonas_euryale.AAC.6